MAHQSLFASLTARVRPRADTANKAGAPAYAYGPEAKLAQLAQLAATGKDGVSPNLVAGTMIDKGGQP